MSISKEAILAEVSSYDILSFYLQPYHNTGRLTAGKSICNPFIADKQQTPSFNIFPSLPSHEWKYKDFATDEDGSCFDLVSNLFKLSFPEALSKINSDFALSLETNFTPTSTLDAKPTITPNIKPIQKVIIAKTVSQLEIPVIKFTLKKKPLTSPELAYWQQFGITAEILARFNVISVDEINTESKDGKPYTIKSSPEKFIFAYANDTWLKLYKPLDEKRYRFQFVGNKEPNYIFGWLQLPPTADLLIITGGEKDAMSLTSHGFNAITLNSETANLEKDIAAKLKLRFKKIAVLYDNDATGIKQSFLLATTHELHLATLPIIPNNGKDVSDFFANSGKIDVLNKLLEVITIPKSEVVTPGPEKVVYNAVELMATGNMEPQYLMSPILPQKGTAVLAGKPDTGKSQFARQLCIQIACGLTNFLNFTITPIYNRAIYVATEDNMEATRYLMNKQMKGLNQEPKENLRFIFGDTMEQEEVLSELDIQLKEAPADLVVVDSFGDIFKGGDNNNNMAMRNTVKTFDKIAKQHNCLILFVHHINKGAYRQAPGQEHIQGGAGLMQKVRLGIQLSEGEDNTRYFTVVKGNYCPREYKQNSIILDFSEETFLFTNTGKLVATSDLGTPVDTGKKEEKYSELALLADEIFGSKILSYSSFVKSYSDITGKSVATAKRAHVNLKKLDLIVDCNGSYRLTNPITDTYSGEDDTPF